MNRLWLLVLVPLLAGCDENSNPNTDLERWQVFSFWALVIVCVTVIIVTAIIKLL